MRAGLTGTYSQEGGDDGFQHVDVSRPRPDGHVAAAKAHRPQPRPALPACRWVFSGRRGDNNREVRYVYTGTGCTVGTQEAS